jgi:hypothetical protein
MFVDYLVIALPFLLSVVLIFVPTRSENPKSHKRWRRALWVSTLLYGGLVWYQQVHASAKARDDQDKAVQRTADRVTRDTTERVTKEIEARYKDTDKTLSRLSSGIDQLKLLTQSRSTDSPDKVLASAAAKIEQLDKAIKEQQIRLDNATSTRTLTNAQQNDIVRALHGSCSSSADVAVVWEPDSQETTDYAGYFIGPLEFLKCLGYRAQLRSRPPLIKGLVLTTNDWSHPNKTAAALRSGLDKAKVPYTVRSEAPLVGSKVSIVVGTK